MSIIGTPLNDFLDGTNLDDTIQGLGGDDNLRGLDGSDLLEGGAGDDTLFGAFGDDTLRGGSGNDHSVGGIGSDIYLFELGWGQDTIDNYESPFEVGDWVDAIVFGAGIASSEFSFSRDDDDLVLTHSSGDSVTVERHFALGQYRINEVRFDDGTVWTPTFLLDQVNLGTPGDDFLEGDVYPNTITGRDGNDHIQGFGGDDFLSGGNGNDTLFGFYGDDTLTGGAGNDSLQGDRGSDTYVFALNWGQDTIDNTFSFSSEFETIVFEAGVEASEITVTRSGGDLTISHAAGDAIFIDNGLNSIDEIQFADDTTWSRGDIIDLLNRGTAGDDNLTGDSRDNTLGGLSGNDTINGADGADFLIGGDGNDALNGGRGSDTYIFALNWGQDTIDNTFSSSGEFETIVFEAGVEPSDVILTSAIAGLSLSHTAGDTILVKSGLTSIDEIQFADGTVWARADILDMLNQGSTGDDNLTGDSRDNTINGQSGNDNLYGGGGADILNGGDGNDGLNGEDGDDELTGGPGTDTLTGGEGEDVYVFSAGWGNDWINNRDTGTYVDPDTGQRVQFSDFIIFDETVSSFDISLRRVGNDLLATSVSGDTIRVNDHFLGSEYEIDAIAFTDQIASGRGLTIWDRDTLRNVSTTAPVPEIVDSQNVQLRHNALNQYEIIDGSDVYYVKDGGIVMSDFRFPGWEGIMVEADGAGGYSFLWKNTIGEYAVWNLDGIGQFASAGTEARVWEYEYRFNVDLNYDTAIGRPTTGSDALFSTRADAQNPRPPSDLSALRDYDGNNLGAGNGWKFIGETDIQFDGDTELIFANAELGRWATVGIDGSGNWDFGDHGRGGETRVVGIYIDPLVEAGIVIRGSDHDSQTRFQRDLKLDNLTVIDAFDFDLDGFQEIYFKVNDGSAYLRALMHADGNIQYANYQNAEQVAQFLTDNGYGQDTLDTILV